jgi:hypothetical protein
MDDQANTPVEKTDEELIHAVERKLQQLEVHLGAGTDSSARDLAASLHRRLNRCLERYNRDHAGDSPVALRSGGGK